MKLTPLLLLALSFAADLRAEDAHATLYVVDRSPEHAAMEGLCLKYTPSLEPSAQRDLLAIAKAPVGATIVMIAFGPEGVHQNLSPVVALQTAESGPARFPSPEKKQLWKYDGPQGGVDLYIAVFPEGDPALGRITEYVGWLNEALEGDDPSEAALHALALKKRFGGILRDRSSETFVANYDEAARVPDAAKAAITRGTKNTVPAVPVSPADPSKPRGEDGKDQPAAFPDPLIETGPRVPSSPVAAARRGLAQLDKEWKEDSLTISFEAGKPGVLIFPLTISTAP